MAFFFLVLLVVLLMEKMLVLLDHPCLAICSVVRRMRRHAWRWTCTLGGGRCRYFSRNLPGDHRIPQKKRFCIKDCFYCKLLNMPTSVRLPSLYGYCAYFVNWVNEALRESYR